MLSSTSSSKEFLIRTSKSQGAIRALAGGLLVLWIFLELAVSLGFPHISKIQRRIEGEAAEALQLKPKNPEGKPTLLLVGNSLILEGTDFPKFKQMISDKYDAHRFIIEQTVYLDWYFALKHIFRHGSRPSVVVLSLSVSQMLADTTRGEFTAHYAMDAQDLPELVRQQHLDPTTASNLLFAHYSSWWGARTEIRKWLLGRILPDAGESANVLGFRPAPHFAPELVRVKLQRLQDLKESCNRNGAQFMLVVPPVVETEDGSALLTALGKDVGVPVLTPVRPAEFSTSFFRDGFHLNNKGATDFTPKLAQAILQ